jgi:hypothetical protein
MRLSRKYETQWKILIEGTFLAICSDSIFDFEHIHFYFVLFCFVCFSLVWFGFVVLGVRTEGLTLAKQAYYH